MTLSSAIGDNIHIACLDESYQASNWYYVAACVGSESQMDTLKESFLGVSRTLIGHDIDPWLEFHGYDIFQGEREWISLKKRQRHRIFVYKMVLDAIAKSGCSIWFSGVDTEGLIRKYGDRAFHPHEVALHNLLDTLDDRYQPTSARIQVIADNLPEKALREARMAAFKASGTMGFGNKSLKRITMPFTWMESAGHAGLQAADMALYIFQRYRSGIDQDPRARKAVEDLIEILRPIVRRERMWTP